MAHKNSREVDSRMSQDLKRKETTIVDDVEECGSLQERPTKKEKIRQFASMPIDTFLKLNNEPDGEEQLDENEGDNIEEQDKDYINPTEAEDIDNTLKGKFFLKDREKIILDIEGEAIGPTDEAVNNLSKFFGTKGIKDKEAIREYIQAKFIIPIEGKRIKIAVQNKKNMAQQKFSQRKGPINFARIRASLVQYFIRCAFVCVCVVCVFEYQVAFKENNEPPTQAEMFVETRQSTKGKSLDEDTLDVIAHLQVENKKSKESAIRAFQSIFRKEKAGRVRCHGRVTTPTLLKKNEEIATLKQQHAAEKATLESKVDVMQKEVDELKSLVKMMLQQKSSGVDLEMLAAQLGSIVGNLINNDAHEEENYVEGEIELD
ncbi:hypothetical protein Ahy_B10g103905 [Arachis hypogaea]|uniref:Uncharacterized protein n=1 Tax=Arachis hypogaea TaxID=3818 RepID=A0A444X4D0_ARAHY|nr:hypothetical protein Ahy_B10g103905 [Arachis hypogaea]